MKSIGEQVKHARGLTAQDIIAERAGISLSLLRLIESDSVNTKVGHIVAICAATKGKVVINGTMELNGVAGLAANSKRD